jgi:hypothetical protein
MKTHVLLLPLAGLLLAFQAPVFAQTVLPEVNVVAKNYDYLDAVKSQNELPVVQQLENSVATFDLMSSDFYTRKSNTYEVNFSNSNGNILATYDNTGNLIRTAERYDNLRLPSAVRNSIAEKYPMWSTTKDTYLIKYHRKNGVERKYRIKLEKENQRMKIETDEKGNIIR